jgi:hypothetical protein
MVENLRAERADRRLTKDDARDSTTADDYDTWLPALRTEACRRLRTVTADRSDDLDRQSDGRRSHQ